MPFAYVGFVMAAAALVYAFVSMARDAELRRRCSAVCVLKPEYVGAERIMPEFDLVTAGGEHVRSIDLRGKVVVLNFWTQTCGPCMKEMPYLADLAKILASRSDVVVLTVSTDEEKDEAIAAAKAAVGGELPFEVAFDPERKIVHEAFGTELFPETWIIDARGVIRARFDGARDWTESAVVEFIDQVRGGGYCPLTISRDRQEGEGQRVCRELSPGS